MKKKILIGLVLVLILTGGIYTAYQLKINDKEKATVTEQSTSSAAQQGSADAQSGEVAVGISDFKLEPKNIRIKKGSVVTWTNNDDASHDVTSDSDSELRGLNSELLSKGSTYSFTFVEAGRYTYHSRPYPYVVGTVEVVE